jgi:8-oxo-dGTP diphosphatase
MSSDIVRWREAPEFGVSAGAGRTVVRPSAYGLIEDARGRLAVVRTAEGVFLPGGGIEAGETPALAVTREAFEECGLFVRAGAWAIRAVQFAYSAREKTHFEKRSTFLDAVVEGVAPAGTEPDHELIWVSAETAPRVLSHESHSWAVVSWKSRAARR